MTSATIALWILLRTLRSPLGWGLFLLAALAWPLLLRWTWIGISTSESDAAALAYEFAFVGALLGAGLALAALERIAPLLRLAAARGRRHAQIAALVVSATLWALVPLAWPLVTGALGEGRIPLLVGALLGALHLSVLGLLLLRAPVPAGTRSFVLVLLAWIVPALLDPGWAASRVLAPLLDAAGTLRPPVEGWSPAALIARLGPMMALALAAAWIDAGRAASPAPTVPHEVRHPR